MKTSKILVIATAAAIMVGGFSFNTVHAAQPGGLRPGLGGAVGARIAERLGLTEEQKQQIKAALAGEKDTLTMLAARLHQAKKSLRDVIRQTDATEKQVREAADEVANVQSELAVERFHLYRKLRPILTSEQLKMVDEFEERNAALVEGMIEKLGQRLSQ